MKVNNCYAFEPGILKREGGDSRVVEELSTTLRAVMGDNQVAVVYEMTHADEVIRSHGGGICPTLQHRMGTGGNQVPMIIEAVSMGHDERSAHFEGGASDPLIASDYKQPPVVAYGISNARDCETARETQTTLLPPKKTTEIPCVSYTLQIREGCAGGAKEL